MKKRETRDISEQDVVEQRTSQTSCGPIRLVKVRARWYVSAVDLGQALGLTEAHNPYNCFKCDLPEKSLKTLYCFAGDKKPRSLLTLTDVEKVLGKKNVRSSVRRERTAVLMSWIRQLRKELAQPKAQAPVSAPVSAPAEPAEPAEPVEAPLPEIALTMETIDGQTAPATTSLKVAEYFGKQHQHVMRDIRETMSKCSELFGRSNFGQSYYVNEQDKQQPMYLLPKDGFLMLAMSYTSPRAMLIKERYIAAFNAMEKQLRAQAGFDMPRSLPEALRAYANEVEAHAQTKHALVETEQRALRAEAERDFEMEARKLDAPKVLFAEAVETGKTTYTVKVFAELFKSASGQPFGQNSMFSLLARKGWLRRVNGSYVPAGEAAVKHWLKLVQTSYSYGGKIVPYLQVMVTASGYVQMATRLLKELESMGFYNSSLQNG